MFIHIKYLSKLKCQNCFVFLWCGVTVCNNSTFMWMERENVMIFFMCNHKGGHKWQALWYGQVHNSPVLTRKTNSNTADSCQPNCTDSATKVRWSTFKCTVVNGAVLLHVCLHACIVHLLFLMVFPFIIALNRTVRLC